MHEPNCLIYICTCRHAKLQDALKQMVERIRQLEAIVKDRTCCCAGCYCGNLQLEKKAFTTDEVSRDE